MKTNTVLWSVSLMVIGVVTVIPAVTRFAGVELADMAVRVFGALEMAACPILGFTSVRRMKGRDRQDEREE